MLITVESFQRPETLILLDVPPTHNHFCLRNKVGEVFWGKKEDVACAIFHGSEYSGVTLCPECWNSTIGRTDLASTAAGGGATL